MRQVYSPYVTYRMLEDGIGYIYISGFHGQVVREVKDATDVPVAAFSELQATAVRIRTRVRMIAIAFFIVFSPFLYCSFLV